VFGRDRIEYKSDDEIRRMRRAGLVVAELHEAVATALAPGLTTADLDGIARDVLAAAGAESNFLGYHGFPAVVCTSVNSEVVHGIPGPRVLAPGDLISVDAGAVVDGWHADAAFSAIVPGCEPDPGDTALIAATDHAMWSGIAALAGATWLGDVSAAIDAASGEYGIVMDYTGHGIGTAMHQPPEVLNYRTNARGPRIKPGMCLAIEPMLSRGSGQTEVLEDDWTVVTVDASRAAHVEHTVAVHPGGIWVLTAPDGGRSGLAPFGVVPVPLD